MIRALVLAAALSSVSTFALAQTALAPAQAQAPTEPATAGEAEFEAQGEAFGARMQAMAEEMQIAIIGAGGDAARASADLDAIETRYQGDVDDFALALETFVNAKAAAAPEAQRAGITASMAIALPQVRAYPQQIRLQVEEAVARATAAATAAAAAAPAPTVSQTVGNQ